LPTLAIALVLVAAVLHAGWNVLLKTSGDTLSTAVRLQAIGTAILLPVGIGAWLANGRPAVPPSAIWLALVSGVLETIYFVCLSAAYRRGPLSLVYPLARGSAPLLAVIVGLVLLGERLGVVETAGIACVLAGILAVARPWRALRSAGRGQRGAIGFALATGASIAAYSAVDRLGVRETEPWLYGSILAVASTAFLALTVVGGRRLGLIDPRDAPAAGPGGEGPAGRGALAARDAAAGILALTAYLLVLTAYSIAPLATVAPLRESGIVLAAAWGSLRLHEASGRRDAAITIAAAGLVVLGAALLAIGG
jgi:drug/metabolite transporter (DMT)-like permease